MRLALSRDIDLERVIESIEVVEQANHRRKLDDLPVIEMFAQRCPHLLIHSVRVGGHALGERERGSLGISEQIGVLIDMIHRVEQVFGHSKLLCQSSMRCLSIVAMVDLRDTNGQHLF